MTPLQQSLAKCQVEGNTLFLPSEQLKNYQELRTALLNAGAKYFRNKFIFKGAAQPFIDRLMGGESVNIKKEFQLFESPPAVVKMLLEHALITPGLRILEPSAGSGNIIKGIFDKYKKYDTVYCYEKMAENRIELDKIPGVIILGDEFMLAPDNVEYDRIIANPPFTKDQDCEHVLKMFRLLNRGGRLVSVMSNSWRWKERGQRVREFQSLMENTNGEVIDLPTDTFKESGTSIASCIVVIDKE